MEITVLRKILSDEVQKVVSDHCKFCPQHSAMENRISSMENEQKNLRSDGGTLSKLTNTLDRKISNTSFNIIMTIAMTVIISLFGLIYNGNSKMMSDMTAFQITIKDRLFSYGTDLENLKLKISFIQDQITETRKLLNKERDLHYDK